MEDYQAMAVLFFQEQAKMRLKLEAIAAKQLQMDKELEDKIHYLQDQQRDIEFNKQKHAADLQEKNRLSRLLEHKIAFQEIIVRRREADLRKEREERINQLVSSRKRERGTLRKLMYYLNMEEQRIQMFRKEDEAWEREMAEHMKRMAAERQLMLDAVAARQLQREMEIE